MGRKSWQAASGLRGMWRHALLKMALGLVILAALMALIVSLALAVTPTFSDVPVSHPYHDAIQDLASRGVVSGYLDGSFRPGSPVIRQQFAKMIVLAMGYTVPAGIVCPFADVDLTPNPLDPLYPAKYVAGCAFYGITTGKTPTTFDPYGDITRQQLITMVVRAAGLAAPPAGYAPSFSPRQFTLDEHYENARKAAYAGLLSGLLGVGSGEDFSSSASRGECAQLLHNLIGLLHPGTTTTTGGSTTTTAAVGAPTMTGVSPNLGPAYGGNSVTIIGTNFIGLSGPGAVKFGSANATSYIVNSPTSISAVVPSGAAGTVRMQVTAAGGSTADTAADDYTYVGQPTVTGLNPWSGPLAGGNSVTITGTNFIGLSGPGAVKFGSANATSYTVNSPTSISAIVPAGAAGEVELDLTAIGGMNTHEIALYRYVAAPTVTGLSPNSGPEAGGTSVTITGTDFVGLPEAITVMFGATEAADFTVHSDSEITAVAPLGAAGTVDVTVTAAGGTSSTAGTGNDYTYVAAGPSPSGWESLGGILTSGPGVASRGVGILDVFFRGAANDLVHMPYTTAGGWQPSESLGGVLVSDPAAASWGPRDMMVFWRGTDNAIRCREWFSGSWAPPDSFGGTFSSGPAAVSVQGAGAFGDVDVFARGTDNALYGTMWDGHFPPYPWNNFGGVLTSDPAAVSWGPGRIDVFARGIDNALWHKWYEGGAWSDWESLGGALLSGPAAASWGAGHLDVFAVGPGYALWHTSYDGGSWSAWESLGGVCTSDPDAVSWGPGRIDVFVRGPDSALWHKWFDGGAWHPGP